MESGSTAIIEVLDIGILPALVYVFHFLVLRRSDNRYPITTDKEKTAIDTISVIS
jgi:hypothetical protein